MNEYLDGRLAQGGIDDLDKLDVENWDKIVSLVRNQTYVEEMVPDTVDHQHWGIRDGPLPDLDELHELVENIADHIEDDDRVFVHCASGINRSGLVSSLVIREVLDIPGDAAVELLRLENNRLLRNKTFREYVEGLARP